jgi:hypothetical protein
MLWGVLMKFQIRHRLSKELSGLAYFFDLPQAKGILRAVAPLMAPSNRNSVAGPTTSRAKLQTGQLS